MYLWKRKEFNNTRYSRAEECLDDVQTNSTESTVESVNQNFVKEDNCYYSYYCCCCTTDKNPGSSLKIII